MTPRLLCAECSGDASEQRPIIKCDGPHEVEKGYHLDCLPADQQLEALPPEDLEWFCPECQGKGLYSVEAVIDKQTRIRRCPGGKPCVHYLVRWAGQQYVGHDSWEPLDHLQASHVKAMVRTKYNAGLRAGKGSRGSSGSNGGEASLSGGSKRAAPAPKKGSKAAKAD